MSSSQNECFTQKFSVKFLEREPQFIDTLNPYEAAKFYKDLADDKFSLYTRKDYHRLYQMLAAVSLYNGRIVKTSKNGFTINFVFTFSTKGNYEEFLENIKQINTATIN